MIYFVELLYTSWALRKGRENSTFFCPTPTIVAPCGSYATILKCSTFISAQLPFTNMEKLPAQK
jgi:hypothetical protein